MVVVHPMFGPSSQLTPSLTVNGYNPTARWTVALGQMLCLDQKATLPLLLNAQKQPNPFRFLRSFIVPSGLKTCKIPLKVFENCGGLHKAAQKSLRAAWAKLFLSCPSIPSP